MLSPTVNILRVVKTKGGKCCLNCLIIRQTNICPMVESRPIVSMCTMSKWWFAKKYNISQIYSSTHEYKKATIATHLLIAVIISIGWGLQVIFISAWKSGRKPSARSDTKRRMIPSNSVSFSSFLANSGSKYQKIKIPAVTRTPTTIFLVPNFNFLSFTREQSTPTKITDSTLQLLTIITTGKLVRIMACIQLRVEMATVTAQMIALPAGMTVRSSFLIRIQLTVPPMSHVMLQGKIRNPAGQVKFSSAPVRLFKYFSLGMSSYMRLLSRKVMQMPSTPEKSWQRRLGFTISDSFMC